jgi:hypothetical protein
MKNTVRNSTVLLAVLLVVNTVSAQLFQKELKLPESKLRVVKTGPFLGVERGKYLNVNFGIERQWQQLKLIRPQTHAVDLQFDYNFKQNVMGAQAGYWFKAGRLNLTYGLRVSWCTDFDEHHRFGVSPNIGYKVFQAHFQLGMHLRTPDDHFTNVNTFYASLRWVFINERKFNRK